LRLMTPSSAQDADTSPADLGRKMRIRWRKARQQ
jgi:hypothetical protein